MATNKDLIKRADDLGGQLNEEVSTDGLNNAQLVAYVKGLAERVAEAAESEATEQPKEPKVKAKASAYCIAEGKSIMATAMRILGPGEDVRSEDLAGGDSAFKQLLEKGKIVKR